MLIQPLHFLQQFKQKIVGRWKENPPQEAFLSVQEKVQYNNVSSTNFMDASPMLVLYGKINAVLM